MQGEDARGGGRVAPALSAADRRTRGFLIVLALSGAVLLSDGFLHGESRHRVLGTALGGLLMLPAASLWLGPRALPLWRRLGLALAAGLAALLLVEATIRILDLQRFSVPELVPDPELGHAHVPERSDLDEWGFRNRSVPERAHIVCLGDSLTFGTNVRRLDSYPSALATRSGLTVYNMSLGGYGPLQYLALTERALSLRPRVLVVGIFLGNDVLDAHRFAGLERHAEFRDPRLAYAVPDDLPRGDGRSLNLSMGLLDAALGGSRLLGSLAHELKLQLKASRYLADVYWQAGRPQSFEQGRIRTLFTAAYRFRSLGLEQPDVRDGLRITALCLERMAAACRRSEVELVLLLIHTKEYAYQRLLEARADPRALGLDALGGAERAMTEHLGALARERSLPLVDPLPEILAALAADTPLWPQGSDGHLNADGCALLAEVLWPHLARHFEDVARAR